VGMKRDWEKKTGIPQNSYLNLISSDWDTWLYFFEFIICYMYCQFKWIDYERYETMRDMRYETIANLSSINQENLIIHSWGFIIIISTKYKSK
jgi:hypothetical protein